MSFTRNVGPAADWREIKLGDVCTIVARQVDPRLPEYSRLPLIYGENVESGNCGLLAVRTAAEEQVISGKYLFEAGDVLYSKLRPYLRKVVVAPFRGLCSADMYPLRPDTGVIDPTFLAYMLLSEEFSRYAEAQSGRARMPKLNREQLFSWTCRLPPPGEQRRILTTLKQGIAEMERARAAAEAQLQAANALPTAYLRAVFASRRAESWPTRRLADVCTLLPSKSIASDGDTVVQAITTACLSETGFRPEGVKPARMSAASAAESVVGRGEILVARSNTRELVGRACLFDGRPPGAVASDLTIRVGAGARMHAPFLAAFLSFLYVTGYWREKSGGASGSMKKITRSQVANQAIPAPELDDQRRVAGEFSDALSTADRIQSTVGTQLQTIAAMKGALLRRAFSGEL